MLNKFITQAQGKARTPTRLPTLQSSTFSFFSRDAIGSLAITTHHAALVLGAIAIAIWCLMFFKPEFGAHIKSLTPTNIDSPANTNSESTNNPVLTPVKATAEENSKLLAGITHKVKASSSDPQQKRVATWLSKRYRLANDATEMLVSAAFVTANEIKLDPLLILAVMAIESGFNPFAESPMGAQGLMQVMSKIHHEKFQNLGGIKAALNPEANIKVGSLILKDYVTRGGSVQEGLKMYVGAATAPHDSGYGSKVLAEHAKLKDVALGKNVPINNIATATTKPAQPTVKPESIKIIDAENLHTIPATVKENNVAAL